MDETPFTPILDETLARVPGAYAAALVDREGETVDYAGLADPFDVKITAAHLRICLRQLEEYGALGRPRWIVIRGAQKSILGRALPDGYALVVLLRRRAGFAASRRAFAACARALAAEAGWRLVDDEPAWHPVAVESDRRGRPRRVAHRAVEVLGAVVGLPARERGFRVRTAEGTELTLVRESRNCWYSDEPVEALAASVRRPM
jgi:hypothetical protein